MALESDIAQPVYHLLSQPPFAPQGMLHVQLRLAIDDYAGKVDFRAKNSIVNRGNELALESALLPLPSIAI